MFFQMSRIRYIYSGVVDGVALRRLRGEASRPKRGPFSDAQMQMWRGDGVVHADSLVKLGEMPVGGDGGKEGKDGNGTGQAGLPCMPAGEFFPARRRSIAEYGSQNMRE